MKKTFSQRTAGQITAAMKSPLLSLLLPSFLLAAPAAPAQTNTNVLHYYVVGNSPPIVLPFDVVVFETPESRECNDISNQVTKLLIAKNYGGLDDFIDKLRTSKATWATGHWKLYNAYCGLCLVDKAPDAAWEARLAALQA